MSEEVGKSAPEEIAEKAIENTEVTNTEKKEELFIEDKEVNVEDLGKKEEEKPKEEEKKEEVVEEVKEKKEEEKPKEEEKEVEKEKPKEEDDTYDRLTSRFSALSRKEKALRTREKELEEKVDKYKGLEDLKKLAEDDPMAALENIGLDYNKLTQYLLTGDKAEIKRMDKIEKDLDEAKQKLSDYESKDKQTKLESAVSNFKGEINTILDGDLKEYEFLNAAEDRAEIVYEIINQDIEAKKAQADKDEVEVGLEDIMPIKTAAKLANQYLEEEVTKYTSKVSKFAQPKVEQKEEKIEPEKEVPESKPVEEKKVEESTVPNTITQEMASTTPANQPSPTREVDIDVIKKQFRGKLFEETSDE